ncbi:MAG TPA: sugar ABC transporter permease [Chloroflexi bacterium]|nr:sugar ABC transporter permease [Chloroflexota bacterium]
MAYGETITTRENHIRPITQRGIFAGRRGRRIREALQAYLFLLPGVLLLLVFNLFPVGYAFYISLHKWRIQQGDYVGFDNYLRALGRPIDVLWVVGGLVLLAAAWMVWRSVDSEISNRSLLGRGLAALLLITGGLALILGWPHMLANGDKNLFSSLAVTFFYSAGTVPLQIILSFLLANILFQNIWGKAMWRIIYFLPYVTVTVASAAVWRTIFDPKRGFVNVALAALGVAEGSLPQWIFEPTGINVLIGNRLGIDVPAWAGGPSLALIVIILYNVWVYVGYNTVIYMAGLGNVPREMYEAAKIDGASRWDLLRHVTIPLVSPTTYFLVMMGVLGTFRAFNHVYVITAGHTLGFPQGTTMTASILIFKNFWEGHRFGYASAMAFILTGVMLTLTWIQNRVSEGRVFYG